MKPFEELIAEGESRPFEGWDFSYLHGRLVESSTPWDYRQVVSEHLPKARSLLDLGTGGGELLSSLHPLPIHTFATEGYPPNVPVAKRRLQPLGIELVETFCDDNTMLPQRGALPFRDRSIDLVIDRHESFIATEVFRVLGRSGRFVTQQVGDSNYPELNAALGEPSGPGVWNREEASRQIQEVGMEVTDSRQTRLEAWFTDVGAVVYYLRSVPWQVPGFSVEKYTDRLRQLDRSIREKGPLQVTYPRFLLQALKP